MLVARSKKYYLVHTTPSNNVLYRHLPDDDHYLYDLYKPSINQTELFESLAQENLIVPRFDLLYQETRFSLPFQLRIVRAIPEEYYTLLWIAALAADLEGNEKISKILIACHMSPSEWDLLTEITRIRFALERLVQGQETITKIVQDIMSVRITPVIIYWLARAVFITDLIVQKIDQTLLVDQVYLWTDLIDLYLTEPIIFSPDPIPPRQSPVPLLWIDLVNISLLLTDPTSPLSQPTEYPRGVYLRVTGGVDKRGLRKTLIWSLWNLLETQEFRRRDLIEGPLILWYLRTEENKLSRTSLDRLLNILSDHPREDWDSERIIMRFRRIVEPEQTFSIFCHDYDQEVHRWRDDDLHSALTQLLFILEILGPRFRIEPGTTWENIIETMISDSAFIIPLLSPRGLLLLYSRVTIRISPFLTDLLQAGLDLDPDWSARHGISGVYNQRDLS